MIILLPLAAVIVLGLISVWTDKKGWTNFRGKEHKAVGTVLQGFNAAFSTPELGPAIEYQKECHDEEQQAGGKNGRCHFPGIGGGPVRILPAPDQEETETYGAVCIVEYAGVNNARLAFHRLEAGVQEALGHPPGDVVFTIEVLGGSPSVTGAAIPLLTAYLLEMEGATFVRAGKAVFTAATFMPASPPYHLLLNR